MKVNVKYFGIIAEKLGFSEETVDFELNIELNLRHFFELKHPFIKNINYTIAVNQEMSDSVISTANIREIALLPPFAGG